MGKSRILQHNLENVRVRKDVFGNEKKDLTVKGRIGFVPISIWKCNWGLTKKLKRIIGDFGRSRSLDVNVSSEICGYRHKSQNYRSHGNSYRNTLNKSTGGWHKTGPLYGGCSTDVYDDVSIFNPHLALMILSAYCPKGAYIYDPFAGGGTRGFIAAAMGFRYYGREIRQVEIDRIKQIQKKLKLKFHIRCADAKSKPPKNEAFDFSYTCPPYWNMEVYSAMADDLSNAHTYEQFLSGLKKVLISTYKALKPGALSIWVVGNFRHGHRLLHFNGDLVRVAGEVGFQLHDEIIFWGGSGQAGSRSGMFVKNRKSIRIHEYIVILKKPKAPTNKEK